MPVLNRVIHLSTQEGPRRKSKAKKIHFILKNSIRKIFFSYNRDERDESFVDTKTPYINRIIEQKSGKLASSGNLTKSVVEVTILSYVR